MAIEKKKQRAIERLRACDVGDVGPVLLISSGEMSKYLEKEFLKATKNLVWASDTAGGRSINFESRASLRDDLSRLVAAHGRPAGIVIAIVGEGGLTPRPLEQLSNRDWEAAVDAPLRRSLFVIQALHDVFPKDAPPILFLGATTGLMGGAQLGPLAAVVEGQRALAKLVARQWGTQGWRVNWLGVSPETFSPLLADAEAPKLPEVDAHAIGRVATFAEDVAPVISLLFEPRAHALTGSTVIADGGYWMIP